MREMAALLIPLGIGVWLGSVAYDVLYSVDWSAKLFCTFCLVLIGILEIVRDVHNFLVKRLNL